jgi:hypothetical protein
LKPGHDHADAEEHAQVAFSNCIQSPARSRIPESCQMLGGFCTLLGSRTLYPVTLVLAPWRYVMSSASTQLRFRLYSQDASTNRKGRSSSGRNLSPVGLRSLVRPCQE